MHRYTTRLGLLALAAATTAGTAGTAWADLTTGPISPYYLNNAGDHIIYVVQGVSVVNSFPWSYACGVMPVELCLWSYACGAFACEANLAIANGHVNTNWWGNGAGGSPGVGASPAVAGQYTLSGTPTGISWNNSPPPSDIDIDYILDGTSDGSHNYASQSGATSPGPYKVVAYNLQWQNPTILFEVPFEAGGITYDSADNALWISRYDGGVISEYSLTGTFLGSFATGVPFTHALAYDPADDTLWLYSALDQSLYQYSKTGVLLQSGLPTGLPTNGYFFAGEIAGEIAPAPEPASLALLGSGLAGLWFAVRRRSRLPA